MRIDVVFIGVGLIFLLVGMVFGAWMGAKEDFTFTDAHAHWNLLGFVIATLYGLIHRAYPKLAKSRLTWFQCVAHFAGVLIFIPGLMMVAATGQWMPVFAAGPILVIVGALMFLFIFLTGDKRAAAG